MLKLPGLIDPHVHVREPGATHKEDWDTATSAALAGGFTTILAMPNTTPPIFDRDTLDLGLASAKSKARCDYAHFLGAGPNNANWDEHPDIPPRAAGLKMYLDSTFGELRLDDMTLWMEHFINFPKHLPIVLHAESRTMAAAILMADIYDRPIHIAHISLKEEILVIKAAKERGIKVTCEVAPHHLILCDSCHLSLGREGRSEVRPRLTTQADVDALWDNLDVIDVFATDHAPHTLEEKDSDNSPPGFPGLETALPLLLTEVDNGRLSIEDIIAKMYINPKKIFNIPEQKETWIEVDENATYEIRAAEQFTKCGWTPFEGTQVKGRVTRVVLRGQDVYKDGKVLAEKGFGLNIRESK
ncbi:MAG: amidohydrolase family protein [Anaerolineae bacterium]|jgi:dihydroorotase-like cyclic amidohydrolase|nr:amidohydrolase family protein [Anaerolineae bacterium]MBT7075002.1 amidohydrolase family protein [Anaerolineae bacterium]MBT7782527.1 amidohydrolase family protein [Anaerolineae bacterium]